MLILALACVRHAAGAFAGASAAASSSRVAQSRVAAPVLVANPGALGLDLTGQVAFVAGVADSTGYGWAICKALAEAGATVTVGTWPPVLGIFEKSLKSGKFKEDMILSDGSLMEITKVYPLDAVFDNPADVPDEVKVRPIDSARTSRAHAFPLPQRFATAVTTCHARTTQQRRQLLAAPKPLAPHPAPVPPPRRITSATRASMASRLPRWQIRSRPTTARSISSSIPSPTGRR